MENVSILKSEKDNYISVCFNIDDNLLRIGNEINKINKNAYMNGYNWEVFFAHYLAKNAPDVMSGMLADPEAGMYAANYKYTSENEVRAEKLLKIIKDFLENEEELYRVIREEGDMIEWD